ncbi:MAG: gliding motility-associated C-terminal domain-containing protein, partial [Crocinitomicaceae bacterium]
VCAIVPPLIYIPNAFFPEGDNKLFYPVISDFDPLEYEFIIFDRWGTELFYSSDPAEAWDGIIQKTGKMATPGTYLYVLILKDGNGEEVVTRGHVSLIQ